MSRSMIEFNLGVVVTRPVATSPWADLSRPTVGPDDERMAGWDRIIRKLHTMLSIDDDWDGMGAKAPSREIVFSAIELASALCSIDDYPAPTRVAATPAGTIGLEWQQPSVYTEAEIVAPYRSEWMQIKEGMPPEHWAYDGILAADFRPGTTATPAGTTGPRRQDEFVSATAAMIGLAYWAKPAAPASRA
jgi:hypothetical protein